MEKNDDTWLDFGASDNFVRNRRAFKTYKSIAATPVDIFDGVAQIVGEGEVGFKFANQEVTFTYKHALKFNKNVLSLSNFIRNFRCEFISEESFESCRITCKDSGELLHIYRLFYGLYPVGVFCSSHLITF